MVAATSRDRATTGLGRACETQLATLFESQKLMLPSPEVCEHAARQPDHYSNGNTIHLDREWTYLLTIVDRDGSSYQI